MTDPYSTQSPAYSSTPTPRRPGWLIPVLVAVAVLVLALGGVAVWALVRAPTGAAPTAAASTKAAPRATYVPDPPAVAAPYTPKPADFIIKLKTTKKECFGSAGCLIDYHIDVTYAGAQALDDSKTYVVTYQVSGVKDGPAINSFDITGDQYFSDENESAQTPSSSTKLKAKATDVEEK